MSIEGMIREYVRADLTIMHAHEVSSNSDGVNSEEHIMTPQALESDAYMEILKTIVAKPPRIGGVASGIRPPLAICLPTRFGFMLQSSQKSGLNGREFSSSCNTKIMAS
ncbi:hypothetical protein ACTXT7_009466 [Hymenolepis weldensis]